MKTFYLFFLIFSFWNPLILAGYIHLAESKIDYQNAHFAQNFSFTFLLETGISASDYIYLKMPVSLGDLSSDSKKPKAILKQAFNPLGDINATLCFAEGQDHNYYFNFKKELMRNTWYNIQLISSDFAMQIQTAGYKGVVEFYTVSNPLKNMIIYDSNTIFEKIQLGSVPGSNMVGSCTIDQNNATSYNNPDAILKAYFDVELNEGNSYGGKIEFILNDNLFIFIDSCYLTTCITDKDYPSCDKNITYDKIQAKCEISSLNKISVYMNNKFSNNTKIRISTFIKNPSFITQGTSTSYIIVRQISRQDFFILNTIQISCNLKVNQIQMNTNIIQLFWGLEPTSLTNNEGCPIVLYKIPLNPKIIPWNNLQLKFSLQKSTPSIPLGLKVDLSTSFQDFLMGSVVSTIPLHSSSNQIKCQILNVQYLYCGKLSNLEAYKTYSISFKMTIKNARSNSILIGGVQFVDLNNNVEYTNMLYPSTQIEVLKNEEYLDLANYGVNKDGNGGFNNFNYNQAVSYENFGGLNYNFGKSDSGLGIGDLISPSYLGRSSITFPWASGELQRVIIFLQVSSLQMCKDLVNRCFTTGPNGDHTMLKIVFNNNILNIASTDFEKGIELIDSIFADVYTNPSILKCNSGWCSQYDTYSSQSTIINRIFQKTSSSSLYNNYHHVTVICQTPAGNNVKQCHQIVGRDKTYGLYTNTQGFSALAFRGVKITRYPSFYADDYSFDFIFCFKFQGHSTSGTNNVASTDESQWTFGSAGIIPGYILNRNYFTYKVSWINYYAKNGFAPPSGDYLPFILRVSLYLSVPKNDPNLKGNTLAFFLGSNIDITAFKEGPLLDSSDDVIHCGNSQGPMFNARVYPRIGTILTQKDVWTNEPRIELDFTLTANTTFDFYIPIKPSYIANVVTYLESLSLAIMNKSSIGYQIIGVYKLLGSVFGKDNSFKTMSQPTADFQLNRGFWGGVGVDKNCVNYGVPKIDASVSVSPNSYYSSNFRINTQVGDNKQPNCIGSKAGSSTNGWGTAFTIASDIDILSLATSFSWDFEGVVDDVSTNICVLFNYRLPSADKRVYTIVCPVDTYSGLSSPTIGDEYKYLTLNGVTWPWWWGSSSMPSNLIRYGWSRSDGLLAAYKSEDVTITNANSCVGGDVFIMLGVEYMKYVLNITPGIKVILKSAATFNEYFIRMNLNYTTMSQIVFERCEFNFNGNPNFTCSLTTFTTYVDFYIKYSGLNDIKLDQKYSIILYLTSSGKNFQDLHLLKIYSPKGYYLDNFMVEQCVPGAFSISPLSGRLPSNNITIFNVSYIHSKSVSSSIQFTFDTLLRDIYKGTQFIISLGFLSIPYYFNNGLECKVYEDIYFSAPSFAWESLEINPDSTKTILWLTPKTNILGKYLFSVKCFGAKVASGGYNSEALSMMMIKVGILNPPIQVGNEIYSQNLTTDYLSFPILRLTKNYTYLGFEANYFFEFSLYRGEFTIDGRILLVFPKSIPSKLNSNGFVKCYLDSLLTTCEIIDENLLSIPLSKNVTYLNNKTYNLDIYGIVQPNITGYNSSLKNKIILMIDEDNNMTNGISVYGELNDVFTYYTNHVYRGIGVLDFNSSNNLTKSTTDFFFHLVLESDAIVIGENLFLKLHFAFYASLLQNYGITCFLYNEMDKNRSVNLIQEKCTLKNISTIAMTIAFNDSFNSNSQFYYLFLKQVSTPIDFPSTPTPVFEIYYIRITNGVNYIYSTANGFFNATYPRFYSSPISSDLVWLKYNISTETFIRNEAYFFNVYIGRYTTLIGLNLQLNTNFNLTYNFSITGNDSSKFLIYPSYKPSVIKGTSISKKTSFYIAGKLNVDPGIYFLTFAKDSNADLSKWTSPIPPLIISLRADRCQISTKHSIYEIPIGKTSFPIFLDFDYCIPIGTITVQANISFGYKEYYISLIDGDTLSQTLNKSLTFKGGESPHLSFQVKNQDIYQNLTSKLIGKMSFKLYGENSISYLPPSEIQLKLIEPISFKTPPIPAIPKVSSISNGAKITVRCSQPSEIFYCLSIHTFDKKFNYLQIKAKTIDENIRQTSRDLSDPYWSIYGYLFQNDYGSLTLNATNLRSKTSYYFIFYCLNAFSIISPSGPNTTWVQNDNGGRISKLIFTFNESISTTLVNYLLCSLGEVLRVSSTQILDSNGSLCSLQRRVLIENITILNTTNISNISNISQSKNVSSPNNSFKYPFFIIPDYELTKETIQDDIKAIIDSSGLMSFANKTLINTRVQTSFPLMLNFTYNIYANDQIYAPAGNITVENTTYSSISFNISLNDSGFIILSLSANQSIKPNITKLRSKMDINGNSLQYCNILNLNQKEIYITNFTNLTDNTKYYLWYAFWNDDPTFYAINSSVFEISATTNKTNKSTFETRLSWICCLFLILFFLF